MMSRKRDRLGILGGMGPRATADFYTKLIDLTPATRDQDHVPVVIAADPRIPDRTEALAAGEADTVLAELIERVETLRAAGAALVTIPCNTAHFWVPALREATGMPFITITDAVITELAGAKRILVLATRGTIEHGIYQAPLAAAGYEMANVPPALQTLVDAAIAAVKRNDLAAVGPTMAALLAAAAPLHADRIVLACTELPIAFALSGREDDGVVDATLALARACVRWSVAPFRRLNSPHRRVIPRPGATGR